MRSQIAYQELCVQHNQNVNAIEHRTVTEHGL